MEANKTTSSCNNVVFENFDWEQYEQSEQGKQAKEQNELDNLKDEITYYKNLIQKMKKDIAKAERNIRAAERELKAAREAEKARKIKELLEANKGKRVIIEWSVYLNEEDRFDSALAEELVVTSNNNCYAIGSPSAKWGGSLEIVKRVFVEADI